MFMVIENLLELIMDINYRSEIFVLIMMEQSFLAPPLIIILNYGIRKQVNIFNYLNI